MHQGRPHRIVTGGLLAVVLALTAACLPTQPEESAQAVLQFDRDTFEGTLSSLDEYFAVEFRFTVENVGDAPSAEAPTFTMRLPADGWEVHLFHDCDAPLDPDADASCTGELILAIHQVQFEGGIDTTMTVTGGVGTVPDTVEVIVHEP